MKQFAVAGTDWHAVVDGLSIEGREILERDLKGFFDFRPSPPPGSTCLAEIKVVIDAEAFASETALVADLPYRDIVMHYPRHAKDRRFGRLSSLNGHDVLHHTTKGGLFHMDSATRKVTVLHADATAGAKVVRRFIRDQLFIPWCESHGGVVVHSSAFGTKEGAAAHRGYLVVGPGGSGKTSFFTAALANGDFRMLSSDRTVIRPEAGKLVGSASPEKINFFPGSLKSYEQAYQFAPDTTITLGDWKTEAKYHVRWPQLFDAFGATATTEPIELTQVVFPRFAARWSATDISGTDEAHELFTEQLMSDRNPVVLPNWLSWYRGHEQARAACVESILALPCTKVTYSEVSQIDAYLDEVC